MADRTMTDIALDEKLEPCPFCGGTVKLGNENIFVCTGCGANVSLYSEDIVSEWNRRPSPSQVAPANSAQVTDAMVEHMVQQFLRWKLPGDFAPDGGISFAKVSNVATPYEYRHEPVGTNLFDYRQAKAMVQHMLDGLAAIGAGGQAVAWRWRAPGMTEWIYNPDPTWLEAHRHEIEAEPLYAQPHPAPSGQAVAVKALEWVKAALDGKFGWLIIRYAQTPFGRYYVEKFGSENYRVSLNEQVLTSILPSSVDEGIAAAQADYERRIRSALSQPHPADERVVEALRKLSTPPSPVQRLGAAISRRDWHEAEQAHASIRDALDGFATEGR